jgi:hypothetical protein
MGHIHLSRREILRSVPVLARARCCGPFGVSVRIQRHPASFEARCGTAPAGKPSPQKCALRIWPPAKSSCRSTGRYQIEVIREIRNEAARRIYGKLAL